MNNFKKIISFTLLSHVITMNDAFSYYDKVENPELGYAVVQLTGNGLDGYDAYKICNSEGYGCWGKGLDGLTLPLSTTTWCTNKEHWVPISCDENDKQYMYDDCGTFTCEYICQEVTGSKETSDDGTCEGRNVCIVCAM